MTLRVAHLPHREHRPVGNPAFPRPCAAVPPQSGLSLPFMAARPRSSTSSPNTFAGLVAGACALAASAAAAADNPVRCGTESVSAGVVQSVVDGRTFMLADERHVRLAAIEVPTPAKAAESRSAAAGLAAKAALAELLTGKSIALKRAGPKSDASDQDRYGRHLAHAVVVRDGGERSVAADLLAQGHAWVAARVENRECAADLFARERIARQGKLGLWADPYYVIRQAEKPAEILAERGRFTLVEGKVLSVRESGGTIYVNFGRRWSEDFTVTIPRRSERAFADAGIPPKQLSGRKIRVRGWVEERGGPWIEAMRPEQIETADRD
jgi:endonuclease YncB( thermonuclease family)